MIEKEMLQIKKIVDDLQSKMNRVMFDNSIGKNNILHKNEKNKIYSQLFDVDYGYEFPSNFLIVTKDNGVEVAREVYFLVDDLIENYNQHLKDGWKIKI